MSLMRRKTNTWKHIFFHFIFCIAIIYPCLVQGSEESPVVKPFKDEQSALNQIKNNPSPQNFQALSRIRMRHALRLSKAADKKGEIDLYILALSYAGSATQLTPDNPECWFLLSVLHWQMKENPWSLMMAEDAAEKAVDLDPADHVARLLFARILYNQKKFSSALDQFETVMSAGKLTIEDEKLVGLMSSAYVIDFQVLRGIKFYQRLLNEHPTKESARIALAILLYHDNRKTEAQKHLAQIADQKSARKHNREYAQTLLNHWRNGEKGQ